MTSPVPIRPPITVQFRQWRSADRNGRVFALVLPTRPGPQVATTWDVLDGLQPVGYWRTLAGSTRVDHARYRETLDALRARYVVTVRF